MNMQLLYISIIVGFLVAVILTILAHDQSIGMWHKQGFARPKTHKEKDIVKKYRIANQKKSERIKTSVHVMLFFFLMLLGYLIGNPYSVLSLLTSALSFLFLFIVTVLIADSRIRNSKE